MPPIVPVLLAILVGIIGAKLLGVSFIFWWAGFGLSLLFAILFRSKVGLLFLVFFFFGGMRYQWTANQLHQDILAQYNHKMIAAHVRVLDNPIHSEYGYRSPAELNGTPVLLTSTYMLSRNQKLWIRASVDALPQRWKFYEVKGIHHELELKKVLAIETSSDWRNGIRSSLTDWTNHTLRQPYNGIALGILLGNHRDIPRDVLQAFRLTGTYHLLVASGLKVSLVAVGALGLTWFLPLSWRLAFSASAVILYASLIGLEPPILRAMTMAIFGLIGFLLGRGRESWNGFLLSFFVLILIFPEWVFDLGFQLSFLSVLGILMFYERVNNLLTGIIPVNRLLPKLLRESVGLTLSAQLLILIPLATEFHNISFVSPLANLLTVPLTACSMALGAASFAMRFLWSDAAYFLSAVHRQLLTLMLWIIQSCARIPFSYRWIQAPEIWTILLVYLLFAGLWIWNSRLGKTFAAASLIGLIFLGFHEHRISDIPQVSYLNDDKSAALISVNRKNFLINGGGKEFGLLAPLQSHGINRLDAIVLTDARMNHTKGLSAVLENFEVRRIFIPRFRSSSKIYRKFLDEALMRNTPIQFLNPNQGVGVVKPNRTIEVIFRGSGRSELIPESANHSLERS